MTLYGLRGFTHGAAKVLTVMSPAGVTAAMEFIEPADDVIVHAAPGRLTQYHGRRSGALERLIETYHVTVLNKAGWDAKKAELGDAIWQ
ncbi:MAG: hypothetical protein ACR2RB_00990 [Gammaproteobacteria bacterium]